MASSRRPGRINSKPLVKWGKETHNCIREGACGSNREDRGTTVSPSSPAHEENYSDTLSAKYSCHSCGKRYKNKSSLANHRKACSRATPNAQDKRKSYDKTGKLALPASQSNDERTEMLNVDNASMQTTIKSLGASQDKCARDHTAAKNEQAQRCHQQ